MMAVSQYRTQDRQVVHNKFLLKTRLISPIRLRQWLVRKGPTFIKLGQFLALRPDILPQAYCDELIKLLDQVPTFSWRDAKNILSRELGCDPEKVFDYINPDPLGAGSLAQVHLARLHSGEEVIIKILRPGIDVQIEKELKHARLLVRLLSMGPLKLPVSPAALIDELSHWLYQELDLTVELKNLSQLYKLTKSTTHNSHQNNIPQKIPKPYPQWCSRHILVTEYIEGVPIKEVMRLVATNDLTLLNRLQIDPEVLAKNLLEACLTQMFDYRFFHMDLHPGNLIVLPGNTLGFVDFGLCGYLDSTVNARQIRYFSAMFSGSSENMFRAAMEILETDEHSDEESFKRDFYAETSVWQARQQTGASVVKTDVKTSVKTNVKTSGKTNNKVNDGRARSKTGQWLIQIMRSARNARMRIPVGVLAMYRTLLTAESVAYLLGAKANLPSVGRQYFLRHQTAEMYRSLSAENLQPLMMSLVSLWRDSPGQLERILADLADRRFTINANVNDSNKNSKAANRRTWLLSLSIMSVGFTVLLTIEKLPNVFGFPAEQLIGVVLVVVYLWILALWRQMR